MTNMMLLTKLKPPTTNTVNRANQDLSQIIQIRVNSLVTPFPVTKLSPMPKSSPVLPMDNFNDPCPYWLILTGFLLTFNFPYTYKYTLCTHFMGV